MAGAHVWSQDTIVSASLSTTYELLRNVQHFDQLTSTVGDLMPVSADTHTGRGRSLFLRDTILCTSSSQVGHHIPLCATTSSLREGVLLLGAMCVNGTYNGHAVGIYCYGPMPRVFLALLYALRSVDEMDLLQGVHLVPGLADLRMLCSSTMTLVWIDTHC